MSTGLIAILVLLFIAVPALVYVDAKKRGSRHPVGWAVGTMFSYGIAALFWLRVRNRSPVAAAAPGVQQDGATAGNKHTEQPLAPAPRPASHPRAGGAGAREAWLQRLLAGQETLVLAPRPALKLGTKEALLVCLDGITLMESRTLNVTKGGHAGTQVGPGFASVKGGTSSETSYASAELVEVDTGKLCLTAQQLVFLGARRTLRVPIRSIVSVDPSPEGVRVGREEKEENHVFVGFDRIGVPVQVDGGAAHEPWAAFGFFALLQHLIGPEGAHSPASGA